MKNLLGIFVALIFFLHSASAQNTNPPAPSAVAQWHWSEPGNFLGWKSVRIADPKVANGALQGRTEDFSRLESPPLKIDAGRLIDLEFRIKSTMGGPGLLIFSREGEERSDDRLINFAIVGDNQFHTYHVSLSSHPLWGGTVAQILFYPLLKAGAQIELQSIQFLPKDSGGLIDNGGFELSDVNSGLPQKWSFQNVKATVVAGRDSLQALLLEAKKGQESRLQSGLFEFPTTGPHRLSFDFKNAAKTLPLSCAVMYFDVFHQPLKTENLELETAPSALWKTAKSTFTTPDLAAYGQITFNLISDSRVTLDNVNVKALPLVKPAWEEDWRANWIMPVDAKKLPQAPRYYRREFTVPQISALKAAKIQITADDTVRLFVNGHAFPKGANWSDWRKSDIFDIKPYLQTGKNIVGVMNTNPSSAEGILAEISLQYREDETVINTDQSWRAFVGDVAPGWDTVAFDDSSWHPAHELGIPPILPWDGLPKYSDHSSSKPHNIKVTSFRTPAQAELGQKALVQLEFVPQENSSHPTALKLHLAPADAALRSGQFDFPPIPLDTSKWKKGSPVRLSQSVQLPRYFPAGEYSLIGSLTFTAVTEGSAPITGRIQIKAPLPVLPPTTKVVYLPGNVPAFEINGKTVPVMHVMTNGSVSSGVRKEIIENSRDNNINLIWLNVSDFEWKPDAPATFKVTDEEISAVLQANPQAYIVLNVWLDPARNPSMKKWLEMCPDQLIQNAEGSTTISGYDGIVNKNETYASFASPIWMNDASQSWRELIRHVRSGPFADRVIGYVPLAGPGAEWWWYGAQKDLIDYSKPFAQAFANWAKVQYQGDLAQLNRTWNTQYASFDAIQLPSKEQRLASDHGTFLESTKSGQVIDMTEFLQEVMADDVLQFCRIVKQETHGTAICGTYYGYVMHLGRPFFGAQSGHNALAKVLASPDIDFLMSPSKYDDRGLGGGAGYMTTIDSIKLNGKLYINQSDIRTFRATGMISGKLDTIKDSVSVLERQFSDAVVNGAAAQWYDFGNGWITGDKRLMQAVGKMHQIEQELQKTPRETRDAPDSIAVITSEKSPLFTNIDSWIQYVATDQSIDQLNRTGVAWDSYLLSDLPKLGNYRYFLFLNCFDISDQQKKFIDENLKKDGKVLVWINAAGIIRRQAGSTPAQAMYDPQRVSDVTGFTLKQLPDGPLATQILTGDNPLQRDISEGTIYGNIRYITGTRFEPQDGVALGRFKDGGETSLAVKKFDHWTSIYSAATTLPATLLRNIARLANVPVVNDVADDATYASKNLFAVHSLIGGERTFTVGQEYKSAKELFSGQNYTVRNGQFTAAVPEGGTVLFLLK